MGHRLDRIAVMSFDEMEKDAARSAFGGSLDRDDERDLVCASAPTLAALCFALLAAENRVVHLDAALKRTPGFDLGHHQRQVSGASARPCPT